MKVSKKFPGREAQKKDRKYSPKIKGLFESLLIIGLILIIPLFFAIKTRANPQPTQNAIISTGITPTIIPATPPSATTLRTVTQQPAQCTFPLALTTTAESTPQEYTFSDPEVVLAAQVNHYSIVEWLPDNQRVLMTQDLYDSRESESDKILRQSIELYNPQTGESRVYAIRYRIDEYPLWQPELNAVVYPAMNFLGIDENSHRYKFTRQVWVSGGNPKTAQMLADNLPQFPLAIKPGDSKIVYLLDKKISKRDNSLKVIPSVPFDLNQWDYAEERRNEIPVSYKMAWQPGTSLIFLYSDGAQQGGGYTFILDTNTGQVCELNLSGWALRARWSPDGKYLAIARTQGSFPIYFSDLAVLDSMTGNIHTIGVTSQEVEGKHYVDDFAWAPDNHHLLAIGKVSPFQYTNLVDSDHNRLYLVDFVSGQSVNLLPAYNFYANSSQNNLAWSPDGSKLLIRCPTHEEERVCFISVQSTGH